MNLPIENRWTIRCKKTPVTMSIGLEDIKKILTIFEKTEPSDSSNDRYDYNKYA